MKNYLLLSLTLMVFLLSACVKDAVQEEVLYYAEDDYNVLSETLNLPSDPYPYSSASVQKHFGRSVPLFVDGVPISNSKATLGRVLFYDKKLSANNKVSCASCHDQARAFADPVAFSEGFEGKATLRNSFALGSVVSFSTSYGGGVTSGNSRAESAMFWDNRATTVAEQSFLTIQDDIEMGMDLHILTNKLKDEAYYKILFRKAYGTDVITQENILDAIAHFVNSMVTNNSRFDVARQLHPNNQVEFIDFDGFNKQENDGKRLYMNNCASCHGAEMDKTKVSVANNGLDMVYEDKGIGALEGVQSMYGVFKVPLLRNIELTGPYMHDGRFETLEEVLEHYNSGVKNHINLHPNLRTDMYFSDQDKKDLVAFLKTLTDGEFTSAVRFSNPFKE